MSNTNPDFVPYACGTGLNAQLPDALHNDIDASYRFTKERPHHRLIVHLAQQGLRPFEIAEKVHISPGHVSTILKQPWARARLVKEMKENAKESFQQLLERAAKGALERVVEISESAKNEAVKLNANNSLLDRFFGKPNQPISHEARGVSLDKLSDAELAAKVGAETATSLSDDDLINLSRSDSAATQTS